VLNQLVDLARHSNGILAILFTSKATEQRVKSFDIIWQRLVKAIWKDTEHAQQRVLFVCTHSDKMDDISQEADLQRLNEGDI